MRAASRYPLQMGFVAALLLMPGCSDRNIPLASFPDHCDEFLNLEVYDYEAWNQFVNLMKKDSRGRGYFIIVPNGFRKVSVEDRIIAGDGARRTQIFLEKIYYRSSLVAQMRNLRRFDDDAFVVGEVSCVSEKQDLVRNMVEQSVGGVVAPR